MHADIRYSCSYQDINTHPRALHRTYVMSTNHIHAVEDYLSEIGKIRATHAGTGETSYYPPLSGLLNAIGETLSPKVRCVIQLQNRGAGMPDGGMFTADQFRT